MKISKRPRAFHAAAAVFGHAYQPVAGADGLVLSVAAAVATQPTNQRPSSLGGANQLPGKGRECEAASACLPACLWLCQICCPCTDSPVSSFHAIRALRTRRKRREKKSYTHLLPPPWSQSRNRF